MTHRTASGAT